MATPPREATWSALIGVLRAVPMAVGLVHLVVAVIVATVVPQQALLGIVWRVGQRDWGVWLVVAVTAAVLFWAMRPPTSGLVTRWLDRRELPHDLARVAASEIARVRRWRTIPALVAALVGPAGGMAVNLAVAELGPASPARTQLMALASPDGILGSLVPVPAAYVLGSVAAELTRPTPPVPGEDAAARLEPRRPRSYLAPWARRLPVASAAFLLGSLVVRRIVGPEAAGWSGVTAPGVLATIAVALIGGAGLQRWVVRRPQRLVDDTARAFDDTARSSTAHAIAGGTSVALLALASELLSDVYNAALDGPRGALWVLFPLALAVGVGVIGVWGRYGSAHPGRRPAEPSPVDRPSGRGGGAG